MLQDFDVQSTPDQGPARLAALRAAMAAAGVDIWLVPRADAHQGEYVAPRDARLRWLTGFSGSAGFCAVSAAAAGVFIDGRYRVQVVSEVAPCFTPVHWPEQSLADWLRAQCPAGGVLGYDPWLHTVTEVAGWARDLPQFDCRALDNLIDPLWHDQPAPPAGAFFAQPDALAGESHDAKRARLARDLGADAAVLTLPDSIAWLLNIRGADVPRNPVPQAFAILDNSGGVALFAQAGKAEALRGHLGPDVRLHDIAAFLPALQALRGRVRLDPKSCPDLVARALGGAEILHLADPCILPKAIKNAVEIAGARAAHLRDGAAMARFLAWLDATAPLGGLSEIDVVRALEGFRQQTGALRDISFETICGSGPNGAIVHYRVSAASNRALAGDDLLLVDSGGQYADGTTDITRTIAIGQPSADQRACYTRVLQGLIAISRARFPHGVGGQHLDALARAPLWMAGQDYDHGTGHGVGSYLSVHEGPQGISRRAETPLQAGMILSNEPGYYRAGAFGIRLENLIVTVDAPPVAHGDARAMLAFETLTYTPFDRRLIATDMLAPAERDWVDDYHAQTRAKIGPALEGETLAWLNAACAPL